MQSRSECVLHEGLGYSSADPRLRLDLFLPPATVEAVPCVMVISGGGFLAQDGQRFRHFAVYLAMNGFAAALIAYRGRPHHNYRETISDAKAAVRFVRSISGEYGIDPDRIGAVGRSARGALAVLLAVTGGMAEFEGDGGHPAYSSRVQAATGIAGVYDFVARFATEEQVSVQPEVDRKIKSSAEWIGAPFSTTGEDWLRASAINHVKSLEPPILLIHSRDDPLVPWMQSRDMHAALIEAGAETEIELSETGGHVGPANSKELVLAFLRRALVEPSPPTYPEGRAGAPSGSAEA